MTKDQMEVYMGNKKYIGWPYGMERHDTPYFFHTVKKEGEEWCNKFTLQELQPLVNNEVDLEHLSNTPFLKVETLENGSWFIRVDFESDAVVKLLIENKVFDIVVDFTKYAKLRFCLENRLKEFHIDYTQTIVHNLENADVILELFPLEYVWVYDAIVYGKE